MTSSDQARDLTVLHVSDTQFGAHHRFEKESLADCLVRDLAGLAGHGVPSIDLIVLSGDIAERSTWAEYEQALAFVAALREQTGLPPERVIVVPGNHDVNWALCRSYFAECEGYETTPVPPHAKKWHFYRKFVTELHGPTAFTEEQPYRLHTFDDLGVVVAAMNSTMDETHRDGEHYGTCGREQLHWFADQLRNTHGLLKIGVLHHNARRKAVSDNENLRDEGDLTAILGRHLDLVLHGHTHEGKEDRLADGTLVLATGSAAVTADWRPADVPNQYQVLHIRPGGLTRWARQWDGERRWIADLRTAHDGHTWPVKVGFSALAWPPPREPEQLRRGDLPRQRDGFAADVEKVTGLDFAGAEITRKRIGDPRLDYLIAFRRGSPLRCVGIVDGPLDQPTLHRFDTEVFEPLRPRGAELVVVHHGPDDPGLRTSAQRNGIRVKTWLEYNDLLDLSAYRTWLRGNLDRDQVLYPQKLYQPQRFLPIDRFARAAPEAEHDILGEIYDRLLDEEGRFQLVLGDAGFGKSFLVRRLAYRMLEDARANVTPIVIYLRDRDKRLTIEEMVSTELITSRATFHADRFWHSLESGTIALLIDGYDEFAVRVGYANAAAQLKTFVDALRGRAKILLTTRPNHFRSNDEVTTKLFDGLSSLHHGRVYLLEPFNEDQQRRFLTRWFELSGDPDPDGTAQRWQQTLAKVDNLPELAKTPRMLSFMVEDLHLDEIARAVGQGTVTAAGLYEKLVNRWLTDEVKNVDRHARRAVPAAKRLQLLENLALRLWRIGERDVTEETLQETVRTTLDLPKLEITLDQATQLIGGRTLLGVADGRWKFAHQSVWEFLLARRIATLLRNGTSDDVIGEAQLTDLTIRFLRDLAPTEAATWAARIAQAKP